MLLVASAALRIGGAGIALALALRSRHVRCICFCVRVALNLRAYHPAPLARAHAQVLGGRLTRWTLRSVGPKPSWRWLPGGAEAPGPGQPRQLGSIGA